MAFFKFRQGEDSSHPTPAQSVEALRQRAKHRLIGSVVLVATGVVGFPLLVDKQPRPMAVDLPIDIPDKNKTQALTLLAIKPAPGTTSSSPTPSPQAASPAGSTASVNPAPAAPAPSVTPASAVVPAAASLSSAEAIEPPAKLDSKTVAKPETKPDVKAEAKAEVKPSPKPDAKSDAKSEAKPVEKLADKSATDSGARALALLEGKDSKSEDRIVIQVGAYAEPKQISEVRAKLERAGFKTYTQVVELKDGKRTRVRVGPFASKTEADKAADKIKKLDLPASILTL